MNIKERNFLTKKTIKRDIGLLYGIVSLLVIIFIIKKPWYYLFHAYAIYFTIYYLIFLPNSLGMTGYMVQNILHNESLAVKIYKLAVKLGTKNSFALSSYGLILLKYNEPGEALKLFNNIMTLTYTNDLIKKYTLSNIAICYWKLGDLDKSLEYLNEMLVDYEYFNEDFYTTLGFIYLLSGDFENAVEYTNKALKENANHGPAFDNLGQICYRQDNLKESEEYFIKALELKNTMADSMYYLGLIYEKQNKNDLAKKYFTQAYNSNIHGLNTITREDVEKKYNSYS